MRQIAISQKIFEKSFELAEKIGYDAVCENFNNLNIILNNKMDSKKLTNADNADILRNNARSEVNRIIADLQKSCMSKEMKSCICAFNDNENKKCLNELFENDSIKSIIAKNEWQFIIDIQNNEGCFNLYYQLSCSIEDLCYYLKIKL